MERSRRFGARLAVGSVAVMTGLVGCADVEEQSLCSVYGEYVDAVRSLDEIDLEQATAGEATDAGDNILAQVRHLGEVADGRYTDQIDQLETALDDLLRVLASVDEDAEPSTWQPLVEESVEDAEHAAARVAELIDPTCQPEPQD